MKIKSAKFETSCVTYDQTKSLQPIPQIAFVGRSNVGKSSLLNALVNQKNLAVTSSTPGRTRLINFFRIQYAVRDVNLELFFVDLPGYGYAQASKNTQAGWGENITEFLTKSRPLRHVFVLLDIRHKPSPHDVAMLHFLQSHQISFSIIATKCDKVPRSKLHTHLKDLTSYLGLGRDDIIMSSVVDKLGTSEIINKIIQSMRVGLSST